MSLPVGLGTPRLGGGLQGLETTSSTASSIWVMRQYYEGACPHLLARTSCEMTEQPGLIAFSRRPPQPDVASTQEGICRARRYGRRSLAPTHRRSPTKTAERGPPVRPAMASRFTSSLDPIVDQEDGDAVGVRSLGDQYIRSERANLPYLGLVLGQRRIRVERGSTIVPP